MSTPLPTAHAPKIPGWDKVDTSCPDDPTQTTTPAQSGHTPGPWHCGEHRHLDKVANIAGGVRIFMAGVGSALAYSMGCPVSETEANAHLIAAAPDLLAALEIAEATLQRLAPDGSRATQGTRDVIAKAIAQAKGTAP